VVQISAHADHQDAEPITCQTFTRILRSGAEYAEFDIRRTADGVLVVLHDARAGRGGPRVADLSYLALCDRLGYPVPRVDEVMGLLAGRLTGHLDLKETGYETEVVGLASSILGPGNFVITTLEDVSVAAIKRAAPQTRTALSLGRSLKGVPRRRWAAIRHSELYPLRRIRACGADWAAINYRLARLGAARRCSQHGVGVMVWTVDAAPLIDRFLTDERIDVLITNRPQDAARRRTELEDQPSGAGSAVAGPGAGRAATAGAVARPQGGGGGLGHRGARAGRGEPPGMPGVGAWGGRGEPIGTAGVGARGGRGEATGIPGSGVQPGRSEAVGIPGPGVRAGRAEAVGTPGRPGQPARLG
jgi:glycerophosphoryl diester phosphodiesterase